ncbi:MAG: hypothetical protein IKW87_09465 [Ruminococcus sp.]|nr:hypothetical protein [Ruminococcus sp.]
MANQKTESALLKKVWDIANVMSSAGVGFTDYITQLTYILFLKMDDEKEEFGLGSSIPEDCKWKALIPDNQVNNLSAGAKSSLEKESKNYALSIIKEAKLIEEGAHVAGANTEVTDSMIHIAVQKNKYSSIVREQLTRHRGREDT